jgi:RNA polymerase sigma-70 factor (ECF subfamily)
LRRAPPQTVPACYALAFVYPSRGTNPQAAPAPTGAVDDEVIAALARSDKSRALTLLMRAYGTDILRFSSSMLGDRALAEDVRQTVFVEAFRDLKKVRAGGNLRAWLIAIARQRCLDAAKARRRWWGRFGWRKLDGNEPAVSTPEPFGRERSADGDRRTAVLRDCLMRLLPHVRAAVLMRFTEGLSYEEIGRLSQEKAAGLQKRVARALPLLRTCIASSEAVG